MKRSGLVVLAVLALTLALAAPAAAHTAVVGDNEVWVGGADIPGKGKALHDSPIGLLPPSHFHGLPKACNATNANPSAVTFIAPAHPAHPDTDSCQHGNQP